MIGDSYVMYILIGIVIVIVLLLFYIKSMFNRLKKLSVNVAEAFSAIETYIEDRFDMLTKVISTANEESKREIEMIADVTKMRSAFHQAKTTEEKIETGMKIEESIPELLVTLENYPDPNFNDLFRLVQRSIMAIEDKISAARRNYNSNVSIFNKQIVTFPEFIIAPMLGFTSKTTFKATAHKRNDIPIDDLWNK